MNKKVLRWSISGKPGHTHNCDDCRFLFCVDFELEDRSMRYVDVYLQCTDKQNFLFRYGSEDYEYASGYDTKLILAMLAEKFIDR